MNTKVSKDGIRHWEDTFNHFRGKQLTKFPQLFVDSAMQRRCGLTLTLQQGLALLLAPMSNSYVLECPAGDTMSS